MATDVSKLTKGFSKFPWTDVARYIVEFAIVFVGVYLAFLLTDYQEELREREVRVKFYENLILEFTILARHLDVEEQKLVNHLSIIEEIEQGKRVIIPVSDLSFAFRDGLVNSAFEGRNFEALDNRILNAIVRGRPGLEELDRSIDMLNRLTTELLPIQLTDENCCYLDNGELVPHLEWYPRLTKGIHELNRLMHTLIVEHALPDLERSKQALE